MHPNTPSKWTVKGCSWVSNNCNLSINLISKRATPEQLMRYKLSLCVHKLHSQVSFNPREFIRLNINQIFTSRQVNFICSKSKIWKIGLNCPVNRLHTINNLIPLSWLSSSLNLYKMKCKELMLTNYCFQNPKIQFKL